MKLRTTSLLAIAAVGGSLAVPSQAAAIKKFSGKTQANRTITLTIGDDERLQSARINWITRRCAQSGSRFQHITGFKRPFDQSSPDDFTDAGSFIVRDSGRIRSRVRVTFTGQRTFDPANPTAETWNGTFKASVTVRRGRKVIDRCTQRQMTWSATLVQ